MNIETLNARSRQIFRQIVESYLETGEPVGSQSISREPGINLSPASVRNVMADLEETGLIYAPHTSAGRVPTDIGLRLFVDGLLEIGDLSAADRASIDAHCAAEGRAREDVLAEASSLLSGLCHCASLVMAPKTDAAAIRHVEFVSLSPERALVVLVSEDDSVENRVIELPRGLPPSALTRAANYLNARLAGRTLGEARAEIAAELEARAAELDELTARVVNDGLASWTGADSGQAPALIVRGRANLLEDVSAAEDLERIRRLFQDLESKKDFVRLLDSAREADGVKIFIGAENKLFSLSGSSLIVSPYMKREGKILGVIGVIGPTRINYARVIPMVDYTARVVSRLL